MVVETYIVETGLAIVGFLSVWLFKRVHDLSVRVATLEQKAKSLEDYGRTIEKITDKVSNIETQLTRLCALFEASQQIE